VKVDSVKHISLQFSEYDKVSGQYAEQAAQFPQGLAEPMAAFISAIGAPAIPITRVTIDEMQGLVIATWRQIIPHRLSLDDCSIHAI
jgi:hypothetical protein